jgi:hypothetical protein
MPDQVVRYQSDLLREVVEDAERDADLSSAEAETLCQQISEATSEREIATVWARLDADFQILDEDDSAR